MEQLSQIALGITYLCHLTSGSLNIRLQKEDKNYSSKGWHLSAGDNFVKDENLLDAIDQLIAKMEEK